MYVWHFFDWIFANVTGFFYVILQLKNGHGFWDLTCKRWHTVLGSLTDGCTPKIAVKHQCSGIHRIAKWVQDQQCQHLGMCVLRVNLRRKIVSHYWNRPCSSESQTFTSLQTSCQNWAAWSPSVQLILDSVVPEEHSPHSLWIPGGFLVAQEGHSLPWTCEAPMSGSHWGFLMIMWCFMCLSHIV